jgi:DNA-binding response OmpR family regulator
MPSSVPAVKGRMPIERTEDKSDPRVARDHDVHVAGLRQKIETNPKAPEYLLTVHRLDYKFVG